MADITQTDPVSAIFLCRARNRSARGYYRKYVEWMPPGNPRVLDVGCGDGVLSEALADRAAFVVGLDISPTMLACAQQRQTASGKTNLAWVVASADALPFRAYTFDYVASCNALRFSNLDASLPDLRRVAARNARIVIQDVTGPGQGLRLVRAFVLRSVRLIPSLFRLYGWRGAWRLGLHQCSRAGWRQCQRSLRITPAAFMEIYERHFPERVQRVELEPGWLVWDNRGDAE